MQATTNVNIKKSLSKVKRKHSRGSKANFEAIKLPDELVDLIKEEDNKSSYIGGILAIIVIALLLGLIAIATYMTMPDSNKKFNQVPFYFSDIFKIAALEANFEFEWKQDNIVFRNSSGNFYKITVTKNGSKKAQLLLPSKYYKKGMRVSMDLTAWLIPQNIKKTTRQSDVFSYELMVTSQNLSQHQKIKLNIAGNEYFDSVAWGPIVKYMIIIHNGNIYYSMNPMFENSFTCLTCFLNQNRTYGIFIDYYAKQIFQSNKAYWWNDAGRYLAFLSVNEEPDKLTTVEVYQFDNLYTQFTNISYSKAGFSPTLYHCQVYVVDIISQNNLRINLSRFVPFRPYYIIHIQWYNTSAILVSILSHEQKRAAVLYCLISEEKCFVVLKQTFTTGWINMQEYQNLIAIEEQNSLAIAITTSDTFSARRHLALVKIDRQSKNIIRWLTTGSNYILKLHRFDKRSKSILYTTIGVNASIQHLYKTNIVHVRTECVTCQITSCYNNQIYFNKKSSTFLRKCLGPLPKHYQLMYIQFNQNEVLWSTDLEWDSDVAHYLKNKSLSRIEYFPIQLIDNNQQYYVLSKIYHPRHLNPDHVIKYPVLLILPDDPFNNNILDDLQMEWIHYLTSFLHYVVIQMEVRGASNHYFKYHTSLTKTLGINDVKDIINGMKYVFEKRKYLDNSSIAVIGQKFGGYLAVKLLYGSDVFPNFRCAMAINPIINFAIYDSLFSERYFQIYKEENLYYKNSKLKYISSIKTKEFFLINDMNQNNVLFENSAKLISDLVTNNIQFDYLPLYEMDEETIRWYQNKYVLKKLTTFLTNCFNRSSLRYSSLSKNELHSL